MPITPHQVAAIVAAVEASQWSQELRELLPQLSARVSGGPSGPSGFSLPGGSPPSGSLPIKSSFSKRRQAMCGKSKNGRRRHERRQTADGTTIVSKERFAKMVDHRVKKILDRCVRDKVHIPHSRMKEIATAELNEGRSVRYSYADATPAGSAGNRFVTDRRGSVGDSSLSSNRGTDGPAPRAIDAGSESLLKLNGRLQRLERELDERRMELKRRGPTLDEIRAFEELEAEVARLKSDLFLERLDAAGSPEAAERSREITQFAYRNGLSYDEAARRLFPLRGR
jgi:hypothetical protein